MASVPGWLESATAMNDLYGPPSLADAEWADAIIFGSPSRFGQMACELKAWIDSLGALWFQGKLAGKVGSTFVSTSTPHGGSELTHLSIFVPMAHFGMVIVPPGYGDPVMFKAGTPYDANTCSYGSKKRPPTKSDLDVGRYQGRRVSEVTRSLALCEAPGG